VLVVLDGLLYSEKLSSSSVMMSLLIGTHEANARNDTGCDVGKLKLEKQTILTRHWVVDFGDAVSRTSDLDQVLLYLYSCK
jgi:hypothetical protein